MVIKMTKRAALGAALECASSGMERDLVERILTGRSRKLIAVRATGNAFWEARLALPKWSPHMTAEEKRARQFFGVMHEALEKAVLSVMTEDEISYLDVREVAQRVRAYYMFQRPVELFGK